MMARLVFCVGILGLLTIGCDDGEKKPYPTTSQSPAIPLPPGMKSPQPDNQPAGEAKPDKQ